MIVDCTSPGRCMSTCRSRPCRAGGRDPLRRPRRPQRPPPTQTRSSGPSPNRPNLAGMSSQCRSLRRPACRSAPLPARRRRHVDGYPHDLFRHRRGPDPVVGSRDSAQSGGCSSHNTSLPRRAPRPSATAGGSAHRTRTDYLGRGQHRGNDGCRSPSHSRHGQRTGRLKTPYERLAPGGGHAAECHLVACHRDPARQSRHGLRMGIRGDCALGLRTSATGPDQFNDVHPTAGIIWDNDSVRAAQVMSGAALWTNRRACPPTTTAA